MSTSRWKPQLRPAVFVAAAFLVTAATSLPAQSGSSSSLFGVARDAAIESSSNPFHLAVNGDGRLAAMPAAPAFGGAGQSDAPAHRGLFSHIAAEAGAGANTPIGNTGHTLTWGGNATGGAGLHLGGHASVLAEFQFIDDKLPGYVIAAAGAQGGYIHVWSLTLDPLIDLAPKHTNSAYVTGGGGFYRKVTSFTDPQLVEQCYYYCVIGTENVVVSHFSSNQGGVNVGLGLTHRLGGTYGDGTTKLFAEARYTFLNTPAATRTSYGFGTTELIPVTLGVRW
jgi:hypothetical protein